MTAITTAGSVRTVGRAVSTGIVVCTVLEFSACSAPGADPAPVGNVYPGGVAGDFQRSVDLTPEETKAFEEKYEHAGPVTLARSYETLLAEYKKVCDRYVEAELNSSRARVVAFPQGSVFTYPNECLPGDKFLAIRVEPTGEWRIAEIRYSRVANMFFGYKELLWVRRLMNRPTSR